jgi:hypothetical protein
MPATRSMDAVTPDDATEGIRVFMPTHRCEPVAKKVKENPAIKHAAGVHGGRRGCPILPLLMYPKRGRSQTARTRCDVGHVNAL